MASVSTGRYTGEAHSGLQDTLSSSYKNPSQPATKRVYTIVANSSDLRNSKTGGNFRGPRKEGQMFQAWQILPQNMAAIIRITAFLVLLYVFLQDTAEGHPLQNQCYMSKYKKIQPSIMAPARMLQNQQKKRPSCHQGLHLRKFKYCDIKGRERLLLTLQRISLVVNVLENMNKTKVVTQNLEAFSILQGDLMNCEVIKSPELNSCRHHLHHYRETVTKECLENDVLLSLEWILTEDLGYLIHGRQSGENMEKMDPPVTVKPPAAKKRKGKRRNKGKKSKKDDQLKTKEKGSQLP
ncbi:uncharacterized protein [Engystomops pustulosus]|uniref:uncharacterized protein n=1 Tax=Engystomops pustulosus TaxID=76066 RepID=UPI003AFABE15